MAVAQLDTAKFAKVEALYRDGATAGERQAASSRMDAMAKAAGMTTLQAAAATAKASGRTDPIAEAQAAAQRQWEGMRSKPDSVRRRARMVETYGSEEAAKAAIFKDTPHEAALRAAVLPFRVAKETTGWKIGSLMGWWSGAGIAKLAPSIVDALKRAVPMPNTVRGLLREYLSWRDLGSDRDAIDPYYDDPDFICVRMELLAVALDTVPATTPDDVMARLDWMQHQWDVDAYRDIHDDTVWMTTLRDDLSRMMGAKGTHTVSAPSSVQSEPLSAAGRRKLVLSILDAEGDTLSDREIARRAGVSPTTVGKLRKDRQ